MSTFTFDPPATVAEAEERLLTCAAQVQDIQAQLADKNRTDPDTGRRLLEHEWHEWRKRAVFALGRRQMETKALRQWLAAQARAARVAHDADYVAGLRAALATVRAAVSVADAERMLVATIEAKLAKTEAPAR